MMKQSHILSNIKKLVPSKKIVTLSRYGAWCPQGIQIGIGSKEGVNIGKVRPAQKEIGFLSRGGCESSANIFTFPGIPEITTWNTKKHGTLGFVMFLWDAVIDSSLVSIEHASLPQLHERKR